MEHPLSILSPSNIFNDIFITIVENQYNAKKARDIWKGSKWSNISKLDNDDVGKIGECTIQELCIKAGIDSKIDGSKTKQIGGGTGDGIINGQIVEIKTARMGSLGHNFQHELGETPWNSKYMVFFDISPTKLYITIFPNFSKEFYEKSGMDSSIKCSPYFPTKSITWRKKKGAFKLDTTIKINSGNKYTFTINQGEIDLVSFKRFIDTAIPL